ncbi:MAG TPA: carbohydrate porin [Stellaceae bacterium]|nr:carbohydrate porin [Stellaceae bacterium]
MLPGRLGFALAVASLCLWAGAATAAPPPISIPVDTESFETNPAGRGPFAFLYTLERSNYLLGDMWGLRTLLSQYGMSLGVLETSEILGNATGGSRTGAEYDGLTQMVLQLDTNRTFGLYGGLFNVSALDIHGRNLSADNLLTLQTASGIEGDRSLRLWELWYQQKFLEEDRLDVKIGQQSLDQEFMVSQNALLFVNTMFGWPMLPSADLPGGGPAYPLSALGVRLRARPINAVTILAGVFNGSPVAVNEGDPQQQNPSGISFPLNGGELALLELQYAYPALGNVVYPGEAEALARTYRIGVWYDTEDFADQRFDTAGLSLANPASSGNPRLHRGDYAVYAVADQMVWVWDKDTNRNLDVFGRVMGTPLADRNLIDFSANAGFVLHQPLPYRNDDSFGIGIGYAHVSGQAAALDRDTVAFTGSFTPVRSGETYLEATYQYQATPWWQLQPDIQYVFNPGAGIANPNAPARRVGDELVLGLRTNILF